MNIVVLVWRVLHGPSISKNLIQQVDVNQLILVYNHHVSIKVNVNNGMVLMIILVTVDMVMRVRIVNFNHVIVQINAMLDFV